MPPNHYSLQKPSLPDPPQKGFWSKIVEDWKRGKLPQSMQRNDDETDFLPAALAAIEQPPSPASRAIGFTIIASFLVALLWASIGTVDIIAIAPGKIIPTGRTKIIQPLEAGVVHSIHVQDGQSVKAGDVLIEIDSTITQAESDRLQKDYIEEELVVARLKAALQLNADPATSFVPPEGASETQIATQRNLLINQIQDIKAKLNQLTEQVSQQQGNEDAVRSTINKLNESLPYLEKRAEARSSLAEKGYGSKLDALASQQDLIEHQQEVQVQAGKLTEAKGAVASLEQQRNEEGAKYRQDNLKDLTEAEQKAASLHEQLLQAQQKFRLQTLTAPVDGTVQQLSVHTEGGVVTPAEVLMAIVPADSHLEIEAMVSNQDIGFVRAGEAAAIKVETFNFTRYGLLHGQVISVSQDAIMRDQSSEPKPDTQTNNNRSEIESAKSQELVYTARVSLDKDTMQIDDRIVRLSPGMAVTVEIKTGSRHIIGYLLSPIRKYASQAMRER